MFQQQKMFQKYVYDKNINKCKQIKENCRDLFDFILKQMNIVRVNLSK